MKKSTKIILIVAAALIIAGIVISSVSLRNGANIDVRRDDGQADGVDDLINAVIDTTDNLVSVNIQTSWDSISGDYLGKRWNNVSPYNVYSIPAENIGALNIDWLAGGIEIKLSSDDAIKISEIPEVSGTELDDETALCWRVENGTLEIKYAARRDELPTKYLYVEIPRTLKLESVGINTFSGYIDAEGLGAAKELNITGNSGNIKLVDCSAGNLNITGNSGNIKLVDCSAGNLNIAGNSGYIKLVDCSAGDLNIAGNSGNIKLVNCSFNGVNVNTVSGEIRLGLHEAAVKLNVSSVSGNVTIRLPADSNPAVEFDTVSGELKAELACRLEDDAAYYINTVSGDLNIKAA